LFVVLCFVVLFCFVCCWFFFLSAIPGDPAALAFVFSLLFCSSTSGTAAGSKRVGKVRAMIPGRGRHPPGRFCRLASRATLPPAHRPSRHHPQNLARAAPRGRGGSRAGASGPEPPRGKTSSPGAVLRPDGQTEARMEGFGCLRGRRSRQGPFAKPPAPPDVCRAPGVSPVGEGPAPPSTPSLWAGGEAFEGLVAAAPKLARGMALRTRPTRTRSIAGPGCPPKGRLGAPPCGTGSPPGADPGGDYPPEPSLFRAAVPALQPGGERHPPSRPVTARARRTCRQHLRTKSVCFSSSGGGGQQARPTRGGVVLLPAPHMDIYINKEIKQIINKIDKPLA